MWRIRINTAHRLWTATADGSLDKIKRFCERTSETPTRYE